MAHDHDFSTLPANVMKSDGTKNFTGRVQHPDAPLSDDDIANKAYVDGVAAAGVTALQGIDISSDTPTDGDSLVYDAAYDEWRFKQRGNETGTGRFPLNLQRGFTVSGGSATVALDGTDKHPESVNFLCVDAGAASISSQRQLYYDLPINYIAGTSLKIRLRGAYVSIVNAPDTVEELDLEVYRGDGQLDAVPTDLVSTSAQTFKDATVFGWRDYDFVVDASGLVAGDTLTLRIKVTMQDSAGPLEAKFSVSRVWALIGDTSPDWVVGRDFVGDLAIR